MTTGSTTAALIIIFCPWEAKMTCVPPTADCDRAPFANLGLDGDNKKLRRVECQEDKKSCFVLAAEESSPSSACLLLGWSGK